MAPRKKDPNVGKALAFKVIFIGGLVLCVSLFLGPSLLSQPQCDPISHAEIRAFVQTILELLEKISEACIIAGLIGIVVDEGLKTKFIQEVVSAASPKLIGRHLPEPVRDTLLNYFKTNFVRPDWEIEYEITAIDLRPEFVKITSRIQGYVHNYGSEPEDYMVISSLDPSPNT